MEISSPNTVCSTSDLARKWGKIILPVFLLTSWIPLTISAQEYFPEDTTYYEDDYYYEDEGGYQDEGYYEDEYYDEYYEGENYDDTSGEGYYEDDYYYEEGDEYYEDQGEYYYEDDTYYEEEGFDEGLDEQYLEEVGPVEQQDELELVDDQAGEVELQEIEKPKIREPRVIRGYTARVSVASPFLATLGFDSFWYSYIDARLSLDFPRKGGEGALAPAYSVELTTFSFENLHPTGGLFQGVALHGLMRIPLGPIEAIAGGGLYVSGSNVKGGAIFGAQYSLQIVRWLSITAESRLAYVNDAAPTGAGLWMDVGGSIGYRF
jgi:hypothetical protein